jgi:hypothetical protein
MLLFRGPCIRPWAGFGAQAVPVTRCASPPPPRPPPPARCGGKRVNIAKCNRGCWTPASMLGLSSNIWHDRFSADCFCGVLLCFNEPFMNCPFQGWPRPMCGCGVLWVGMCVCVCVCVCVCGWVFVCMSVGGFVAHIYMHMRRRYEVGTALQVEEILSITPTL